MSYDAIKETVPKKPFWFLFAGAHTNEFVVKHGGMRDVYPPQTIAGRK